MLENIRIVELAEGLAGPLATSRLADLGAEVIKLELQGGDWMRGAEPRMTGTDVSAAFYALNRGKRSVALGPNPEQAAPLLLKLLARADAFVTDRSEDELTALGLGAILQTPWPDNPNLIVADVSTWGAQGPLAETPGSELTAQAFAGYTRYLGARGEPPRRLGADVGGAGAGVFTAQAVLAALLWRLRGGTGQRVSTSVLGSLMSMKSIQLAAQSDPDQYAGPRVGGPQDPPERGWNTKDGPIFFAFGGSVGATGRPGWTQFVEEVGLGHLLDDAKIDRNGRNTTGHGSLVHKMRHAYEAAFVNYTADDLVARIRKYGANVAKYQTADATLAHPQTQALGIVQQVEYAGANVEVRGFPARFSRFTPSISGDLPELGSAADAIASELGLSQAELQSYRANGGIA
jgi:crotonobetainyl-CoA:carnitine CoA-transferase CaiB-like acyl-CoA transferase